MKLSKLLPSGIACLGPDVDVTSITADSREVRPGTLFAALPGTRADGASFVPDAVARGAVAVLTTERAAISLPAGVALLRSPEPRRSLALLAAAFFERQPAFAVAVTGTNGKTSVAEFTRQILCDLGRPAASLGTIGVVKPDGGVYGSLTTPDPVTLHRTLAELAAEGITHLAFEASSHGLDQHRLDGVRLSAGAFTNLGRDHLDYHPTLEAYLQAKLRLFTEMLQPGQAAVVNADGPRSGDAVTAARARGLTVLTTGRAGQALRLQRAARDGFAQRLEVVADGRTYGIRLGLIGEYQAENALVAAGLAIALGERTDDVLAAVSRLQGVNGRLEVVGEARGGLVVVDYAHKPEALAAALDALRPFATGRLVCVFGCGGDRDRGKRPIMGAIASEKADAVYVTDDNPRSEVPGAIRAEILAAAPRALEIGDRGEAIHAAIAAIRPGDVLLIAGQGHETGQIIGDKVLPFSDHAAAKRALQELSNG